MPVSNADRTGDKGKSYRVDRVEQLALYDALPRRWRRLADSLPVIQDLRQVTNYYHQLGDARGYAEIVKVFRTKFVGWVPPEEELVAIPARRLHRIRAGRLAMKVETVS